MQASTTRRLELTRRQTLFWLDEALYPGAPYHHHALTIRLEGGLDRERLVRAFRQTERDIDQLRVVIETVDGRPTQRVRDDLELPIVDVDLSETPDLFARWLAEESTKPFRFEECLHRVTIVKLGPTSHVFVLSVHHIIADGASIALLVHHLAARYGDASVVEHPSYLEYVESERHYLGSPKAERDARYWKAKLAGGVPPFHLYGRPRTSRSVESYRRWVDGGKDRLRKLEARAGEDPFRLINPSVSRLVALTTTLFAFLHRVSGNKVLAIGTPVPNRTARFLDTCGLLMEQVFLKVEIDDGETFESLADKVRRDIFQSFRHAQHCVSDRGVEYATLNLLTQRFDSFDDLATKVRLQASCTMPDVELPGVLGDTRDTFGIQVHDFESADTFLVGFDMHRATFDAELRDAIPRHFFRIVDALTDTPDRKISEVDLLDDTERAPLLALGRGDDAGGPAADVLAPIHASIARRAEHPALIAPEGTLSYAHLGHRMNALARALVERGVVRESRVGIYLPRGRDEIVAMLATLEAGGAYVPLDPSHPVDRIGVVLEDAAPEVLVTTSALARDLAIPAATTVLAIDEAWPAILELDASPLALVHDPEQLAYVLFTSGSTGRPKGVEIPRRAFANFLRSMAHTPGLVEDDRLLAVTTITFDIAGLELFLPLTVGATVRLADRETAMDPALLRRVLEAEPITVMQATPATWRLLVETGWQGKSGLKMLVGGEALSPELAAAMRIRGDELWNVYGPTETTVWSTVKRLDDPSRITIGRAIDRTQVYVLDAGGHVVPMGVIGELAIGGDGVARGYRDRPELTASRFVESRYGAPGDRVYLTGDLARQLPDGDLECLGRIDHQVKIRGFRIELGEIESVLRAVPGVRDAVVLARKDLGPDPRLVGYYVADGGLDDAELLEAARAKLPSYMHPSAFVALEAFPLNTNGKVDRNALPAPAALVEAKRDVEVRPRNDAEVRIACIFRDVLGLPEVGIDEDFFALGGTSPLAIEVRRRIEHEFGLEVPLRALFESPTVAGLASRLGEGGDADKPIVVKLRSGGDDRAPIFCLVGVQLYDDFARSLGSARTVYGVHVPIRYSPTRGDAPSVPEIAARYAAIVREIRPRGPYLLLGLCFGGLVAFEVARLLRSEGETVELVGIVDAVLPRAFRVAPFERARSFVTRSFTEPERIPAFLRHHARRFVHGMPASSLRTAAQRSLGLVDHATVDDVIDMPIGGAATRVQFDRYDRVVTPLDVSVLVFRAGAVRYGAGISVDTDCGFADLAHLVDVKVVEADHLGLLRRPHAERVAQAIETFLDRSGPAPVARPADILTAEAEL